MGLALLIAAIIVSSGLALNSFQRIRPPARFSDLTCTKHVIVKSMIPGGPDHWAWAYGPHRTSGNKCDGGKHIRKTGWW